MTKGMDRGKRAEELACAHLRNQGYQIIERSWRSPFGELDIVARDGESLVFVEVKARAGSAFGGAEEALTKRKRDRLVATAAAYLAAVGADLPVRFDLLAVTGEGIVLYKDAFRPEAGCSLGS